MIKSLYKLSACIFTVELQYTWNLVPGVFVFSIDEWARPIFGVASDMKSLSRDKREERDYANLSQAARRRLSSSGERRTSQEEEYQ